MNYDFIGQFWQYLENPENPVFIAACIILCRASMTCARSMYVIQSAIGIECLWFIWALPGVVHRRRVEILKNNNYGCNYAFLLVNVLFWGITRGGAQKWVTNFNKDVMKIFCLSRLFWESSLEGGTVFLFVHTMPAESNDSYHSNNCSQVKVLL